MTTLGPPHDGSRAATVEDLRRLLPRLESFAAETATFPFGLPELDRHFPKGGLAAGALHEVVPASVPDTPAAFGFLVALLGLLPKAGPILFVASPRGLAEYGTPHGHGLNRLGLDPARLIFAEASTETDALWAMEEGLHSGALGAVAGAIGTGLDLKASRRLHVAAGKSAIPLLLLRPAKAEASSAAATRWRIGSAPSVRDRFGLVTHWRWRAVLERVRNGRPGEFSLEWDHAAYRFSLSAPLADHPVPPGAIEERSRAGADRS